MTARVGTSPVTMPLAGGFRFGEWTVLPAENAIRRDHRRVRLEPKVMRLLLALVARHDEVCRRDELLDELWPSPDTTETSLTRALSELRRALGDSRSEARYIETIQRVGYKAVAALAPLQPRQPGPPDGPFGRPLDNAQETVLVADYLVARRNAGDLLHAIELLAEFAEVEPEHAEVFATLAHAERILPLYHDEPEGLRVAQARRHAREALRLDGGNGLAWAVLGGLAHDLWNWRDALAGFERAMACSPFDANVLRDYAELLLHLGAPERALRCAERACRIKPVSAAERMVLAWLLLHEDSDRADRELAHARRLGARTVFADNLECLLLARRGWPDDALDRRRVLSAGRDDDPLWIWSDPFVDATAGDGSARRLARETLRRVEAGRLDPGVAWFQLACAGPMDAAFEMADRAIAARRFFVVDPWLHETRRFRESTRFEALRSRLGLGGQLLARAG